MLKEVNPLVADFVTQFTPDTAFAFLSAKALLEVAFQQVWGHGFYGIHAVNALLRRSKDTFGNIRSANLPIHRRKSTEEFRDNDGKGVRFLSRGGCC